MPEWDMEKYRFYVDLPGDFWESGVLQQALAAQRAAGAVWDPVSGQYVLPYRAQKKVFQVTTEVQMLDPADRWVRGALGGGWRVWVCGGVCISRGMDWQRDGLGLATKEASCWKKRQHEDSSGGQGPGLLGRVVRE